MTAADSLIVELRSGPERLAAHVSALSIAQQRQPPSHGGFAMLEHVCHLRDYEDTCLHRLLRMLVEESPVLEDFEGARLAIARGYVGQGMSSALADFAANRNTTLRMLTALSDDHLRREGILGGVRTSIHQLAEIMAAHDRDHLREIGDLLDELHAATAADVSAIHDMAREFSEAFNGGDVDRMMRFCGDRYVDVNLRVPHQSREERRRYYAALIRRGAMRVAVHPDEIVVHGSIAVGRGRIEVTRRDSGVTTELRYLEVLRKDADGWKAVWGIDGPVQEQEHDPERE